MKRLLLPLLGVALIWMGCGGSSYVTQDVYLAHQGFVEFSKGNYSLAEANLLVSLDIKANNPYTLLNLGAVYQDTGRAWQAVEIYEKLLELNPEQTAVQSNNERYRGKSLVEITKENLRSLAFNDSGNGPIYGPFDMGEVVNTVSDIKTLSTGSKGHKPSLSDPPAIKASIFYVEEKQESIALTLGDHSSAVGISAIGASAVALAGESGGGNSKGGGPGDVGSGSGGAGDGGSDGGGSGGSGSGGGSGDGGSDGGGAGDGGNDGGGSGDSASGPEGTGDSGSDGGGSVDSGNASGNSGGKGGGHGGKGGGHGGKGGGHGGKGGGHGGKGGGHGDKGGGHGGKGGGKK